MTNPLGVYVHWPFCSRICPYCDFNVYKNKAVDAQTWTTALKRDLNYWAERTKGRKLTSLYFGGGTPSLAPIETITGVVDACAELWGFEAEAEITLEANPTDAERTRFDAFAKAGVNRLSLGVQSLRDDALIFLGRNHNANDAKRAIETARSVFERITFDLIYARPDQSIDAWRNELSEAIKLGATHLSLYQLTIEPGTAFAKAVDAGRWAALEEDQCADQFALTQELTEAAGLPAYEISNHAALSDQSRHNLIYWRYQDYIGVGPGAHGRLTWNDERIATQTHDRPDAYLTSVEKTGTGLNASEQLDQEAQLTERLSMGLRLREGITLYADDYFYNDDTRAEKLLQLTSDGLLANNCGRISATPKGRPLLNAVIRDLLT
ncbi:MAG: coproporphyrinogen III oxidase [Hyphococcus sp.]|nr:MAG: coproporphyrinogen III oxidase [Marinicaulis sp.]